MSDFKIGVLGGTFDPIHMGHLIIAEEVRQKLGLDEVLFVPTGQPWLKGERSVSSAEHRMEMVIQATASNPHFNVSSIELERPGPTYSIDTITELKAGLSAGDRLYFIEGFDALAELSLWKDPGRLVEMCQVVGVRRPGCAELDLPALESAVPGISENSVIVDVPQIDISASEIRRRVSQGLSIRYLVPEAVERYIKDNGLYLQGGFGV
ncbi:MAG: nicotinate-nucleotide adenylyltransferase [Dehalococcoidia bacterium]